MIVTILAVLVAAGTAFYVGYRVGRKHERLLAEIKRGAAELRERRRHSQAIEGIVPREELLRAMRDMNQDEWNAFFFHAGLMTWERASKMKLDTGKLHASGYLCEDSEFPQLSMRGEALLAEGRRLANRSRYWAPEMKRGQLAPYLQITDPHHPALDAILWLAEQKNPDV